MSEELLIDFSQYQGSDFNLQHLVSLADPLIIGGFMRSTIYASKVDNQFFKHWKTAEKVGLRRGVYHLARYGGDPVEQARWHHAMVGPLKRKDLGTALDFEEDLRKIPSKNRCEWILKYADESMRLTGRKTILYTGAFILGDDLSLKDEMNEKMVLWLAQYTSSVRWLPKQFDSWAIWQYSGDGGKRLPGVRVDVDRNTVVNGLAGLENLRDSLYVSSPSLELIQNNPFALQRALQLVGEDPGTIDGIIGKQTKSAISSFLNKHGLNEGELSANALISESNTEHIGSEILGEGESMLLDTYCDAIELLEPFGFSDGMCAGRC